MTLLLPPILFAGDIRIGVVTDGPYARPSVSLLQIQQEIEALLAPEHRILFPDAARHHGNWQVSGIKKALDRLLADSSVDLVFVMGPVSVVTASHYKSLAKPVLAPFPVDNEFLRLPVRYRASGIHNFYYLSDFHSIADTLETLKAATGARHIHVLADGIALSPLDIFDPERIRAMSAALGVELSLTLLNGQTLPDIPDGAGAVLLGPLPRLTGQQFAQLTEAVNARQLPSFALGGHADLGLGALLTDTGDDKAQVQIGRRVALVLQRILAGEDPGQLDVSFNGVRRIEINLDVADKIGYSPPWSLLLDARYYDSRPAVTGDKLSLTGAMNRALEQNLLLRSSALDTDIAGTAVTSARSQLLPQLGLALQGSRIDADRASPLTQAEQSTDISASASMTLYSDDAWSAYRIQQHLQRASRSGYRTDALDTLQQAAQAYVNLLRSQAIMAVRRADVEATRQHLQSARLRQRVGFSGPADALRWESEMAADKQAFLAAQADYRSAGTVLNQVLHLDLNTDIRATDADLNPVLDLLRDPRLSRYLSNPAGWQRFKQFVAGETLANRPEIDEIDALIEAQSREVLAARRKYYLPDISLQAQAGSNLSSSGAGTGLDLPGVDDDLWSLAIRARLPLFTGGALKSRLAAGSHRLQQLQLQRQVAVENLLARASQDFDRVSGSYPAIELAQLQADSAERNLEIVTDGYSRGAVDITRLVDAQNTLLQARLNAAQARFRFLADFINALRSMGDFTLLMSPGEHEHWIERVSSQLQSSSGT